jgi:hypothetical protein
MAVPEFGVTWQWGKPQVEKRKLVCQGTARHRYGLLHGCRRLHAALVQLCCAGARRGAAPVLKTNVCEAKTETDYSAVSSYCCTETECSDISVSCRELGCRWAEVSLWDVLRYDTLEICALNQYRLLFFNLGLSTDLIAYEFCATFFYSVFLIMDALLLNT